MWQTYNNIQAEYPAMLQIIILTFVIALLFIVGSACFEILQVRKREGAKPLSLFVLWKVVGGAALLDPAFWAKLLVTAYFAQSSALSAGLTSPSGSGSSALLKPESVVLCIFVLVGYAAIRRVYDAVKRLRVSQAAARLHLVRCISSRIVAGSALIAMMHFVPAIEASLQRFS
jgi:hypothetical protein